MTSLTAYLIAEDVGEILEDGDDELESSKISFNRIAKKTFNKALVKLFIGVRG